VLPDVEYEQRRDAGVNGRIRIAGGDDSQLAVVVHQPDPAAAELADGCVHELPAELVDVAELVVDPRQDAALGLATAIRRHALPEERVVPGLERVVEDADLRLDPRLGNDLLEAQVLIRRVFDQAVELVDIPAVMLVIVIGHRLRGNMRFERVPVVG
jgi:hypothetical protein